MTVAHEIGVDAVLIATRVLAKRTHRGVLRRGAHVGLFVAAVQTVVALIALEREGYAAEVVTLELSGGTACGVRAVVRLVTAVATIVVMVAHIAGLVVEKNVEKKE